MLPYTWITAEAKVETVIGNLRARDREEGLGDVTLIPVMLGWKEGAWQYDFALSVYAPTGEYEMGRLANPGLNYRSINPIAGAAYSNPKTGFNAALHGGILFNTENPDTVYLSGMLVHLEGSVQQLIPAGKGFLSLGLEGFWVEQVTADSGQRTASDPRRLQGPHGRPRAGAWLCAPFGSAEFRHRTAMAPGVGYQEPARGGLRLAQARLSVLSRRGHLTALRSRGHHFGLSRCERAGNAVGCRHDS